MRPRSFFVDVPPRGAREGKIPFSQRLFLSDRNGGTALWSLIGSTCQNLEESKLIDARASTILPGAARNDCSKVRLFKGDVQGHPGATAALCPAPGSCVLAPTLTERIMRRIALLWLVLTPLWIGFSFYASTSKIAFVPPALAVIVAALYWLHAKFVVAVAGEPEPRPRPARVNPRPPRNPLTPPVAAPSPGLVRPALIAVGVGACFGGAAIAFFQLHRPVANYSAAANAIQSNAAIAVQTEAVKSQSLAAEPKAVPTQGVQSPALATAPQIKDNPTVTSSDNAGTRRAEAQISPEGQQSSAQPRCNVSLCETHYQSFRASDCTYQPYSGARQYCAR